MNLNTMMMSVSKITVQLHACVCVRVIVCKAMHVRIFVNPETLQCAGGFICMSIVGDSLSSFV